MFSKFANFSRQTIRSSSTRQARFASVLVLADHMDGKLSPATLNTVTAAGKIGGDVSVLVAGQGSEAVATAAASVAGVSKVLHADDAKFAHSLPENVAPLVCELQAKHSFSHILASASTIGKNVAPRIAAELDVSQVSEILSVESADTFKRPIYAGNAIATVKSSDAVKVITVRGTAFERAAAEGGSAAVEAVSSDAGASDKATFESIDLKKSDRPELTSAGVVVAGGRALKDAATFSKLLDPLANKLNAAIGASRAAVDAGFCPNDMQIGQTGKIVAPDLYIAIGISGAIQHVAGMKDSKVIVSINKDEDAPIYAISDYWIVGDAFKVVDELTEKL